VQPREGVSLDQAELEAVVRKHVAGYKVPRTVWLTDHIGRTPSGKADYTWARRFADEKLAAMTATVAAPATTTAPPAATPASGS
jgi:acyl-CoA synthetase (AMP-forming)/AMP-acid ligase II